MNGQFEHKNVGSYVSLAALVKREQDAADALVSWLSSDPSSAVVDNSHTNYSHLSKDELVERLKNVLKSRKSIRAKYDDLQRK